jgi:hypothetical protein
VPVRNCPFGKDDRGKVYLIKEKTKNKLLKKLISALGRSQDFHIHLDELGSAAWQEADGQRTVLAIGAALKEKFPAGVAQAEARLAKFFVLLVRDGFVRWRPEGRPAPRSRDPRCGDEE